MPTLRAMKNHGTARAEKNNTAGFFLQSFSLQTEFAIFASISEPRPSAARYAALAVLVR